MSQSTPIVKRNQRVISPPLNWAIWSRREYHRLAALYRPMKKREQAQAGDSSRTIETGGGTDARH